MLLSNDGKWGPHINSICKKANTTLGFKRRNLYNCPKEFKEVAYFALVRSKIEYASCIWNPYLQKDINQLESIQNRGARFVCHNYNWNNSVTELKHTLGWNTLEQRRTNACLCMFYKIVNNEVAINMDEHLDRSSTSTRRNQSQHRYL